MQRIDIRPLTIFLFVSVAFGQSTQERVFHFKPADAAQDVHEIATAIQNTGDLRELSTDAAQKTITIHGTAGEIAFSDWLH